MGMSASQTVPQQQSSPYFGMQTQPAQPLNQIGDMSFAQPAVMPTQPQPAQQQPLAMSIDEFARSPLMGAMTQEARNPVEYQGSMRDPELVRRYEAYTSGQIQQPMQQESPQDFMARMNQVRQARLQFGPTPGQPQNPYVGMSTDQLQQMNEQIRMQRMQADAAMRNQVPWYMRPPGMNEQPSPTWQPSQPYQRQMPYQMPYQQPMYQQPYQSPFQRSMSPFGGLAALFSRMRGF